MPIHTDNTTPNKKRVKKKHTVGIGTGSNYINLWKDQGKVSVFSGVAMDSSDTIYVNSDETHLAEESALTAEFGSVPASYTEVSIVERNIPETYVKEISHYEAWT